MTRAFAAAVAIGVGLSRAGGPVRAQTTVPAGPSAMADRGAAADPGPDVDPAKLAASPFTGSPVFRTFRSFAEGSYAAAKVSVRAAGDGPDLYDANVGYDYPPIYRPTWGEVFDDVARQMRCRWSFDPRGRQFTFAPSDDGPAFGVTLAVGWRRDDRGRYVWHAPADQPFGLDIYDYGTSRPIRRTRS